MTFRRRQFLGWGVLVFAASIGALWLAQIDYARKVSTDVLDLIPTDERAPELTLIRQLASQAEARTMFFVITQASGETVPASIGEIFAAELVRSAIFDQALPLTGVASYEALGRELFTLRFTLLFPQWLREREAMVDSGATVRPLADRLAIETAAALERFLATPEALVFQELIAADPLLLMPRVVSRFKNTFTLPTPSASEGIKPTLVWARLGASPLSEAGQGPAFAAIERATANLRTELPGIEVTYTGINRFAAASRARIEREVSWLNAASLIAVLTVALLFIRRVHRGLHLVPVVLLAMLAAWVWTTLAFERLHVLVFVVGALLTGVAIDYGFYLFMQPPAGPDEDYWAKVRRLAKPLLASCLTTVAGFALLLFSELPLIRQLGIFVGAGLVSALLAAVIYFSTVKDPFLEARVFRGGQPLPAGLRRGTSRLLLAAWLVALPGLVRLTWNDDIRELEIPSAELKREDRRIRALFGEQADRTVYLTYGTNVNEARDALERFAAWLQTAGGGSVRTMNLAEVVPTSSVYERARNFVREQPQFPERLRTILAAAGFETDAFNQFFADYARFVTEAGAESQPDRAVRTLQAKLTGPIGLLLHNGTPLTWFVTVAEGAPALAPPVETHTVSASQLQSLNRIFSRYRQSALWLSLIGLAIVGFGVFLTYGLRDGGRIFAIPCGACLGFFGLLGWIGQPLNLFHLLGAFLGVCLTHNYSIFTATSAYRHEAPPVSVRLSALTTAASFGVLALSDIPVVRALGSTVAAMVVISLLMIETEHLSGLGQKP